MSKRWNTKHAGNLVELNGPGSQLLDVQGTGEILLAYEPKRQDGAAIAQELDVRVRVMDAAAILGDIPVVGFFMESSHGDAVWREPFATPSIISGSPFASFTIPARGMHWRIAASQFRIGFSNISMLTGAPLTRSTVQVSVQPGFSELANTPPRPYQQVALATAGAQQPLPMTAKEWRLHTFTGAPFAPAAAGVIFIGLYGALFGPLDAAVAADYIPIPHDAAGWVPSVAGVYATYR